MLDQYITRTQQLLQYPASNAAALYSQTDITNWINQARGWVAGDGECIRVAGTLTLTAGTRTYPFSAINLGTASSDGVQGTIKVEQALFVIASGYQAITVRSIPWFWRYHLANPVPPSGQPKVWMQYGQGSAPQPSAQLAGSGGSIYFDPIPDQNYSILLDCVCYPYALASDSDPEALPYLFTDAVPYYAAYLALMSAQTNARIAYAGQLRDLYREYINNARRVGTPSVLAGQYVGSPDLTLPNKLGAAPAQGNG